MSPRPALAGDDYLAFPPPRFLLFAGVDLWRAGGLGHGGLVWSPQGIDKQGFAFKLLLGEGAYRYSAGATDIDARQFVGSAMPGWRIKSGTFELTAFAGLDVQNHRLWPDDPASRLHGTHVGLRAGVESWWEPVSAVMLSGAVSVSSVGTSYWGRLATGYNVLGRVWIGPEITALGDTDYHQLRVGAHVTGFKVEHFEWSGGLGYVHDSDTRAGLYARVGLLARR